jgi:hypothetical protein
MARDVRSSRRFGFETVGEEVPMSYPYPQDLHRDRKEKGEQPYQDAKQTLAVTDARIRVEAEAYGEARKNESEEERTARFEAEAEERLRRVGDDLAATAVDRSSGAPEGAT